MHTAPSTDSLKILFTKITAPSGSTTRVGAALLLWVWATAQTGQQHKRLSLRNVL